MRAEGLQDHGEQVRHAQVKACPEGGASLGDDRVADQLGERRMMSLQASPQKLSRRLRQALYREGRLIVERQLRRALNTGDLARERLLRAEDPLTHLGRQSFQGHGVGAGRRRTRAHGGVGGHAHRLDPMPDAARPRRWWPCAALAELTGLCQQRVPVNPAGDRA